MLAAVIASSGVISRCEVAHSHSAQIIRLKAETIVPPTTQGPGLGPGPGGGGGTDGAAMPHQAGDMTALDNATATSKVLPVVRISSPPNSALKIKKKQQEDCSNSVTVPGIPTDVHRPGAGLSLEARSLPYRCAASVR